MTELGPTANISPMMEYNDLAESSLLARILEPPSYGFVRADGRLSTPSTKMIFREFLLRVNPFLTRKNWLPFWGWATTFFLLIPFFIFIFNYFSFRLLIVGFIYTQVLLGTHLTLYYHRYSTHKAYKIRNKFWLFIIRNLVPKTVPEETFTISHYVHHRFTEMPGDPYNVFGGWLYCFLADAIHQPISRHLSESDYARTSRMIAHTGVRLNSYRQYKTWGSVCHPGFTVFYYVLSWSFWYAVFYFIGGNALATALFGLIFIWVLGIRAFNFSGHGGGMDKRRKGVDFNHKDLSINQAWPGLVSGQWHSNHHLYPGSARSGFLKYQLDLPWHFIKLLKRMGAVTSYQDSKQEFLNKYIF